MKPLLLFLVAVAGGVIGAGVYSLVQTSVTTPSVAPDREPGHLTSDDSTPVLAELRDLEARIEKLESRPGVSGAIAPASFGAVEGGLPAPVQHEILEAARTAAREEMTTLARAASAETRSAAEREIALELCLEQLNAPHEDTRRNGIRRLRRMFASEASPQVLASLEDESAMVRREAAAYFEYLWDPDALEPLIAMMNEEDDGVAEQALDALCKSGDERAVGSLQDYYLKGPGLEMAYEAGKALEENSHTEALPTGIQRFRDALRSSNPRDRELGVAGIRRWGSVADEPLIRRLETDADARVRALVKRTLETWGRQPAPP